MTTTRTTLPDGSTLLGSPLADATDPDAPVGGIQPIRIGTPLADAAEGNGAEPEP